MKRLAGVTAATVLALGALTSCGGDGDSSEDYCGLLEEKNDEFSALGQGEPNLDEGLSAFEDLRDAAPSDIQDDYDTLIEAIQAIQDGDVGGIDQEQLNEAVTNLQEHAESECDVSLQ